MTESEPFFIIFFLNQNTCKLLKIYLVFSFEGSYNTLLSLRFRPTVTASPLKPLQNELMIAVLTTVPCHLHEPVCLLLDINARSRMS